MTPWTGKTEPERLRIRFHIVAQVHRLLQLGLKPPFTLQTDDQGHYRVIKETA